jgi:hypothetical protein
MASHASSESSSAQHLPPIASPTGRFQSLTCSSDCDIFMEGGIGRVGTSRGSSGCRFFGSPVGLARGTEVLLVLGFGNRAPTAPDALLVIYQLWTIRAEKKILHRIVENMRMHNCLDFKNYLSYGCSVVQCDGIVRTLNEPPSYKGRPEVPRR